MVYKYYGGVLLRELPVRPDYPYVLIFSHLNTDGNMYYYARYTKHKVYTVKNATGDYATLTQSESIDYITMFTASNGIHMGWLNEKVETAKTNIGYVGTVTDFEYTLVWTNTDILKDSADSTDVHFVATDPVLFEGMFIKSCIPVPNLPSDVDRSKYPYTSEFNYSICQ